MVLIGVVLAGPTYLLVGYFMGAAHSRIARFDGKTAEYGVPMAFGLVYFFAALSAMGLSVIAEKYRRSGMPMPVSDGEVLSAVGALSLIIAGIVVVVGVKIAVRFFFSDVVFAHWWSTRVVAVGRKRDTMWWSQF